MIPLIATEEKFVESAINGKIDSRNLNFKYAIAADEYMRILNNTLSGSSSSSEAQILTGLLRDQALIPIKLELLAPKHTINFQEARPEYIELSFLCTMNFIHDLQLPPHDESIFSSFRITLHQANNIDYVRINQTHTSNVISSWNLNEGGTDLLSSHAVNHLEFSSNIKIYDRYFSHHSLSSLTEMFSAYHAINGTYTGSVHIYYGQKLLGGVTVTAIKTALSPYVDPSNVHALKCDKASSGVLHAHDRYMQIDERSTFQFTAGLGCYCESNGRNRASTVMLKSIISSSGFVDILDENNVVVRIRF